MGPDRVWLQDEDLPGLAMSRSVGDFVSKAVGVTSEPEFYERPMEKCDKMLLVASDGIWEFMTNAEVSYRIS